MLSLQNHSYFRYNTFYYNYTNNTLFWDIMMIIFYKYRKKLHNNINSLNYVITY